MKYRHTITGAIIDVKSKMSGAWEPIEASKKPDVATEEALAQKKRKAK